MTVSETQPGDFSISDAASLIGVSVHTLRYYEKAGLMLDPVPRAPSTHRRYREDDVNWLRFITRLRSTGMSIRQIEAYAAMVRDGAGNEAERLTMLEQHRELVRSQLLEIEQHLAAITFKIDLYRNSAGET